MTRSLIINKEYAENSSTVSNVDSEICSSGQRGPRYYKGEANYQWSYTQTGVDIGYLDEKYQIPVGSGWEHLTLNNTYVLELN